MTSTDGGSRRTETDASLQAERLNTDRQLARRVTVADADVDDVLRLARERADRLLHAARAAADAQLPLSEQTRAAVNLLLSERQEEDRELVAERERADELLDVDRRQLREQLAAMLVLERQTTDLHLALERSSGDRAVSSRDDFLAQASHDLRGLSAANKIYLALLSKESGNGGARERMATYVATLVKIDEQMDRLVNDLVDIVAIEAGKLAVRLTPHSAAGLLSTMTAIFEPLARQRGQSLSVTTAADDVRVMADPTRAIQVLGNLLSNAIKFTPPAGNIRVGFDTAEDDVTFVVADTGPGVPAELTERIFERFVGSASARTGLGLGLFIAARLVDAQGGHLWLDREPGQGAVFRFTLERAK